MGMGGGGHFHRLMSEEEEYSRRISDTVLIKRLMKYTLNFKGKIVVLLATLIAATGLNLLPPVLFTIAVDRYISAFDLQGLSLLSIAFIGLIFSIFLAQYFQNYLIEWLGHRMEYEIRMNMFRHLQRLSIGYYSDKEVGSIVSRVTNDVEKITELISSGVTTALADIITLAGIIVIMLLMNLWLSIITFTVIPMVVAFMYFWGRRVRKVYRETRKTIASVSARIEESVSGIKEIQAFSKERETQKEFQKANVSNMQANIEAGRVMSAFWPAVGIFGAIGNSLVLWFGGSAVMSGTLTIGILFGFMAYINRFFMPIQDLSMFWNSVQSAMAAAERVFLLLDSKIEVKEKTDAVTLPPIKGAISYENVTFSYEQGQPVLKEINLMIEPKKTVALVGPTGAGKTTMINLLYRFYDPDSGRITIDGYDLRDVKLESLRSQMAIVLQDPFLFTGSVKMNIKYGRLDATDDEIIAVAKAVGAHDFIASFPKGYETEVGERGSRLSLGQRQLITLARALIADPKILIMDEATSSIDAYTELIIKQALEKILKNRTSIVIAHRLSTVMNADLIVVIDEGRIVEKGTHKELLESGGLYRRLYETQFKDTMKVEDLYAEADH
ncbi:ABC transporter ATP-binding protein [Candidatus Bathyarchaeota archaeon]|nr:ABC transporter ATP-binding protein [Candidatus Bathyarchaeota archaeon]MBS7630372.1 ABC transporter ATP-binding protein [Candidatus Bathyarchaeota archaeon]